MMAEFKPTTNHVIDCSWEQRIPNSAIANRNFDIPSIKRAGQFISEPSLAQCYRHQQMTNHELDKTDHTEINTWNADIESDLLRLSYYNPNDSICYKASRDLKKTNRKTMNSIVSSYILQSVYPCQTKKWFNNQTRMKALSDSVNTMCARPERQCRTSGILQK